MAGLLFLKILTTPEQDEKSDKKPVERKQNIKRTFEIIVLLIPEIATISSTGCLLESYTGGNVQQENKGCNFIDGAGIDP
jgi:hypothetical protein